MPKETNIEVLQVVGFGHLCYFLFSLFFWAEWRNCDLVEGDGNRIDLADVNVLLPKQIKLIP